MNDGDTEFLEHLAATNFPLVPGMKSFPDNVSGLNASRNISGLFTTKINFQNFSKGFDTIVQPENQNHKKQMNGNVKILASKVSVAFDDNSKEEDVVANISLVVDKLTADKNALASQVTTLTAENKKLSDERITFAINAAKEAGKILPADEADWKQSLEADFDSASKLLAKQKSTGILATGQIKNGGLADGGEITLAEKEDFDYLQKNDPDKLASIKASKPEVFKVLWEAHYKGEVWDGK